MDVNFSETFFFDASYRELFGPGLSAHNKVRRHIDFKLDDMIIPMLI